MNECISCVYQLCYMNVSAVLYELRMLGMDCCYGGHNGISLHAHWSVSLIAVV